VIYYPEQNVTVLLVSGLPQLQGSQVYQGWLLENSKPISIGLLNVQNQTATLGFRGAPHGFEAIAVSLERGPSATPLAPKGAVVAESLLNKPVRST
jgi:anti-sigma-K factor RskA